MPKQKSPSQNISCPDHQFDSSDSKISSQLNYRPPFLNQAIQQGQQQMYRSFQTLNVLLLVACLIFIGSHVTAYASTYQAAPPPPPPPSSIKSTATQNTTQQEPAPADPIVWQVRVGDRASKVASYAATIDRVVLVPDQATFLTAISMWGFKNGRWPILIEDDFYTPIFIRRFQPQQILRLPGVGSDSLPKDPAALQSKMLHAVSWIWRNPAESRTQAEGLAAGEYTNPQDIYNQAEWLPPGIVITSATDPAWPAAVTYAASYGQPLLFLEGDFGQPNDTLDPQKWATLNTAVEDLVRTTGYQYQTLNDDIDTLTIVRQLAARYRSADDPQEILAVTDGLARQADARRWAMTGWQFGSSVRSVFAAMSSIFIRPQLPLLIDTYPADDPRYAKYRQDAAPAPLQAIQMHPQLINNDQANLNTWHEAFEHGFVHDALLVNSSGQPDQFKLTANTPGYTQDIPILRHPASVYFVHSWSAKQPDDLNTIAGRFLDNGAIAYVGAINEPFLQAFVPPTQLAERLKIGTPFLLAARFENLVPWKILTIGDPLATFKPKGKPKRNPDLSKINWPNNTLDLSALVGQQALQAAESNNWAPFFDTCRKMNRGELALRYYRKEVAPTLSPATDQSTLQHIIPVLFEQGTLPELAHAISSLPENARTRRALDMLWSRTNPQLANLEDETVLQILIDNIRQPRPAIDASRLAATIVRLQGSAAANTFLDQCAAIIPPTNKKAHILLEAARPTKP